MSATTAEQTSEDRPIERVSFSSINSNNLGTVRVLNTTLFPVRYSEKFYKDVVRPEVEEFCKLIYMNDIPVGNICCRLEEIKDDTRLYLMTMGILAPYRNRKTGSRALQYVLDAARASEKPKISSIYLHVQFSNEDAKRFYERHGFVETGLAVDYYKKIEPRDAWILEYKLRAPTESECVESTNDSPPPAA